ncbi:MAG: DNA primase [Lachnospiraceae bacterium]|jgi:DNA primase|nr:DNA primase [Lachnospiraceae bacterium]
MYYEDSIIDEVRSRNDIVQIIGTYVKLKRAGSNYQGLCPFHSEKTPSFSVSPSRQTYKCFGCGKGGNVFTFLMEYENLSFPEALRNLADRVGIQLPQAELSEEARRQADLRTNLLELYKKAATFYYRKFYSEDGKFAREYIVGRGLSAETMKNFGIGYSDGSLYKYLKEEGYRDEFLAKSGLFTFDEKRGVNDKFFNRVMFPIFDTNGKVIAFGGRVMGDGLPKYLNSPETLIFDKSRNLYGMHLARRTKQPYMLLCEGYMDTIALHQAGFDNAVASLGTSLTGMQAKLLSRYTKEVVITYDSDGAGQKAASRAIPILAEAGIRTRVLNMSPYKDPDEFIKALGKEAYEERIREASASFTYEVEVLRGKYNLDDPRDITQFQTDVANRILEFSEDIERTNYMKAFCRDYNVDYKEFRALFNKLGAQAEFKKVERTTFSPEFADERKIAKSDTAARKSQRIVLTRCSEEPELIAKVKPFLSPDDFDEGTYRDVARILFEQYEKTGKVDPSGIISRFESKEEQTLVAELCETRLVENTEGAEARRKEFADSVRNIIAESLDRKKEAAMAAGKGDEMMQYIKQKKDLEKVRRNLME